MNLKDLSSGICLAAFAGFVIWEATRMQYFYEHGPGPGFLPFWIGLLIFFLSAFLAARSFATTPKKEENAREEWQKAARTLGVWASFVVMAWLIKPAGFMGSFAALTFFLLLAFDRRPPVGALATAAGIVLGFYLVFVYALDVRLPVGPWGF